MKMNSDELGLMTSEELDELESKSDLEIDSNEVQCVVSGGAAAAAGGAAGGAASASGAARA